MKIIELQEQTTLSLPKQQFDEKAALTLHYEHNGKISIEFPTLINNAYLFRSNGFVGYIPIDNDYSLRIIPKVPIKNIFKMLEYAYQLHSFAFSTDESFGVGLVEDIFESIADILTKRILDRSRKGLYIGYISREDQLSYIRGRTRLLASMTSIFRGSPNLLCAFEDHTADLEDNQILAWTLLLLTKYDIKRGDVKNRIHKAYRELINKVTIKKVNWQDCVNRFYHRLNEDYRVLHGLCRFFLEHGGPDFQQGNYQFIPFTLHMPTLFESFVAEWLNTNLPPNYRIEKKYRGKLDSVGHFKFEIDLLLIDTQENRRLAVLDTKYKRKPIPDADDVEQIIAYAAIMRTADAFLIFPSIITEEISFSAGDNIKVHSLVYDLSKDPEVAGHEFLEKLKQNLADVTTS